MTSGRVVEGDDLQGLARRQQPAQGRADDVDQRAGCGRIELRDRAEGGRWPAALRAACGRACRRASRCAPRISSGVSPQMTRPWFCMRTARGQSRPVACA